MSVNAASPDTPPTSATSSASTPPAGRKLAPKASRQRFKPQLSCMLCRTRKLKCDRNLPCDNCQKRGVSSSCSYVNSGIRDKASQVRKGGHGSNDLQARIRHLEEMVTALATSQQSSRQGTSQSDAQTAGITGNDFDDQNGHSNLEGSEELFGRISIEDNQPNYVGSAHWAAVLDNIAELKDSLEENEKRQEGAKMPPPGPDLLLGANHHTTREEILAAMPSRTIVDQLVMNYFKRMDLAPAILHVPNFFKEYEDFWRDPSNKPIMWIGLLFSILTLSAHFHLTSSGPFPPQLSEQALRSSRDLFNCFRQKTVQCLILGNYTEPILYTVETLVFYMVAELARCSDFQFSICIILGIIVRSAMRMGYHRDASHYPNISVFQGEMQRRLWAVIEHLDLQTSSQVGLPRMIKKGMSDTALPRNLLDEDFSPESTILPPPRPDNEPTPLGYLNVKHRITSILGEINDQANSVHSISHAEVMRLDAILHEVHAKTPEYLKLRGIDDLRATPNTVIKLRKLALEFNFQKSRCVLHRKFLVPAPYDRKALYPYSVQSCVDASMKILHYHMYIYDESKPKGFMFEDRWKIVTLMANDYLLAGMLVLLYLGRSLTEGTSIPEDIQWSREEMLQALDDSYKVWEETSQTSKEATKAVKALKAMMVKIRNADHKNEVKSMTVDGESGPILGNITQNSQPGQTAVNNYFSSGNGPASWHDVLNTPTTGTFSAQAEMMENMISGSSLNLNLDWELWDSQFQGAVLCDTPPGLWNFDTSSFPQRSFPEPSSSNVENILLMDWGTTLPASEAGDNIVATTAAIQHKDQGLRDGISSSHTDQCSIGTP